MTPVKYHLADPTGNITLLVEVDGEMPDLSERKQIADALMALEPTTEQVGFVRLNPEVSELMMAGGEFCGNASLSAAACHCRRFEISQGDIPLKVSGIDEPLVVSMVAAGEDYTGTLAMPIPLKKEIRTYPLKEASVDLPTVFFPGTAHIILEKKWPTAVLEQVIQAWQAITGTQCLGIMSVDRAAGTMTPLVYVATADTLFWENACASGTTAVAAWYGCSVALKQPGGTLSVRREPDGRLMLQGGVKLLKADMVGSWV